MGDVHTAIWPESNAIGRRQVDRRGQDAAVKLRTVHGDRAAARYGRDNSVEVDLANASMVAVDHRRSFPEIEGAIWAKDQVDRCADLGLHRRPTIAVSPSRQGIGDPG